MRHRIGVTSGMAGLFAVLYDNQTGEPIQTGIGRYRDAREAESEARDWAESEAIYLDNSVPGWQEFNLKLAARRP